MAGAAALAETAGLASEPAAGPAHDLVIKGGRVIDPAGGVDAPFDVAIANGRIAAVLPDIAPGNARRNLPGLHATYLLFDARTGVPLAQMDGDVITARRTAAASALAGSYLAREEAKHLVLVGAGRVAKLLPAAWKLQRAFIASRSSTGLAAMNTASMLWRARRSAMVSLMCSGRRS